MRVLHIGIWKIKTGYDFSLIKSEVDAWSSPSGISGCITSVADAFHAFLLPKELADTFQVPVDPSWQQRGYTHGLYTVFADEESRKNYDTDSRHLAFSDMLIPALEDGMNSVLSFDMLVPESFNQKS